MNPDFVDLLRSLLAANARFMVVDAYAVGLHGRPRATKDLDVWVEPSSENAPTLIAALVDFGAPLMGLTIDDLKTPGVGIARCSASSAKLETQEVLRRNFAAYSLNHALGEAPEPLDRDQACDATASIRASAALRRASSTRVS